MEKKIFIGIVVASLLLVGIIAYRPGASAAPPAGAVPAVQNADGSQTIDITARGGYSPRLVSAKAGIPTTIRVITQDTYDCSASLVIPKVGLRKLLSSNGTEEINISADKAQGTLNGLCGMGMYSFKIVFNL